MIICISSVSLQTDPLLCAASVCVGGGVHLAQRVGGSGCGFPERSPLRGVLPDVCGSEQIQ